MKKQLLAVLLLAPLCAEAGDILIQGRNMRCEGAEIVKDSRLENFGLADMRQRVIVLNLREQQHFSREVKWFIFLHECGHLHGHLNEKKADAWAVAQAAREGWLTTSVLREICQSYGPANAPATRTHPAPRDRCNALQRVAAQVLPSPTTNVALTSGSGVVAAVRKRLPSSGFMDDGDDDVAATR